MKQDIKLYIDDKLVDFSNELIIPFTYQLKDVNKPTVVKNPFTKTITIIGTKNNNKIFGEIYNLDREQLYDDTYLTGAYFNPSYRTPFKLFKNGELIESGYMQLNSITIKNKVINYEVTLYGGLGDYLYSLMYNKDSEPLKLSDLVYGVENEETGSPFEDSDREMDFTINKQFVYECFNNVGKDNNNTLTDYITFVPSYNGLPENFDSDKVLINTHNNSYISPKLSATVNNKAYTPYNNYILATLPRKYNEWEMLDLRSYLQRPAIKMSKIIDACCNPVNNGGYTVELDTDFFNDNNPYYKDAWIALPLLTNLEKEKNNVTTADGELYRTVYVGELDNVSKYINTGYFVPLTNFTTAGDAINYESIPIGTLTNIEVDFNINFNNEIGYDGDVYLLSKLYNEGEYIPEFGFTAYSSTLLASNILLQLIAFDGVTNEILSYGDILCINNVMGDYGYAGGDIKNYWSNYLPYTDAKMETVEGNFKYENGTHTFYNTNNQKSFRLKLDNIPYRNRIRLGLRVEKTKDKKNAFKYRLPITKYFEYNTENNSEFYVDGYIVPNITRCLITRDEPDSAVASNSKITKQFLLKTEKTPADYLLGYCKMFDLHFSKVNGEKIIKIQSRNNFYNGNIIDWTDKIDWSKDFKIKPICFDKKFYQMGLEGESYYLTKYKNEYSVDYGQKRINTNYNFNADTTKLYDDNVYQNAVSAVDTSPYYHTFIDKDDRILAPFASANFKYNLFNVDNNNIVESTELTYETPAIMGAFSWNRNSGYDNFAKTCFYTLENDEKSLSDISSVLLFYNGNVEPRNFDGGRLRYKLSDDVSEMYYLNNKVPCWLFSDYDYTEDYQTITYDCTTLPQFLRYKIVGNQVQASWDFGKPKESYIPNIVYNDNTTLYNQYWQSYYEDMLNVNTKQVECYVNLNDVNVNGDILRNFYYFNGCYWILNKIDNYNVNKFESAKCTFVKVNNIGNYKAS